MAWSTKLLIFLPYILSGLIDSNLKNWFKNVSRRIFLSKKDYKYSATWNKIILISICTKDSWWCLLKSLDEVKDYSIIFQKWKWSYFPAGISLWREFIWFNFKAPKSRVPIFSQFKYVNLSDFLLGLVIEVRFSILRIQRLMWNYAPDTSKRIVKDPQEICNCKAKRFDFIFN